MRATLFIFALLAIVLTWFRLFLCPYVPFTGPDVKLFMALAHEINGAALGASVILWVIRQRLLGFFFFALWLIPGIVEGICFASRISH
jgi:hypothetical protein